METTFLSIDYSIWFIIIIAFLVLFAVLILLLFRHINKLKDKISKNTASKNNPPKTITEINNIGNNDLSEITRRLNRLENQSPASHSSPPSVAPVRITSFNTPVMADEKPYEVNFSLEEKPKATEFYMSTPNPDGSFEADQGTDTFRNTVSLYKFTVGISNPTKATFVFNSDAIGISDSLNNPKTFIEPVCYQANDAFPGARQIITTQPGTAEKRNNKWVVVDKAKIKYQ